MEKAVPLVTEPSDAIVRTTSVTICGSDLHIYLKEVPAATGQIRQGDILGHEAGGVVEEVGPQVTKFKKGDRVAISGEPDHAVFKTLLSPPCSCSRDCVWAVRVLRARAVLPLRPH